MANNRKSKYAIEIIIEAAYYSRRMQSTLSKCGGREIVDTAGKVFSAERAVLRRPCSSVDATSLDPDLAAIRIGRSPKPAAAHHIIQSG